MEKGVIKLAGTIQKFIDRSLLNQPPLAHISLLGADHLYDELRVPNIHQWGMGKHLEVTIRLRIEENRLARRKPWTYFERVIQLPFRKQARSEGQERDERGHESKPQGR
jgi:hypothetical protein